MYCRKCIFERLTKSAPQILWSKSGGFNNYNCKTFPWFFRLLSVDYCHVIERKKVRFSIARVTSTDNSTLITGLKLIDEGEIQISAFEENGETNIFGTPILEVVADIPQPDLKTKNTNWEENLSPEMTEKFWPKDGEPELHVVYGQRIFKGN